MTASPPRAQWPGLHGPAPATPRRRPGSVRRTTTVDILRPDGLDGGLVLVGHGRDLVTHADGTAEIVGEATMRADVDYDDGRRVLDLVTDPPDPALGALIGRRASSGYRRSLDELLAHRRGSALFLLLDDLPMAAMISGNVFVITGHSIERLGVHNAPPVDVCIGWRHGGLLLETVERTGRVLDARGPRAPALVDASDPLGWHPLAPLTTWSMRRARRLDVHVDAATGDVVAETMFRDVVVEEDGHEYAVHEYDLTARVDARTGIVTTIDAVPRAAPGPQCPGAATSAQRIVGAQLHAVRAFVRDDMPATTSCTHLNDALRALGDVHALAAMLPDSEASP